MNHLPPAAPPSGWHRVAYLSSDLGDLGQPQIGAAWTAKSDVKWILSCQTLRGAERTVVLELHAAGAASKTQNFTPESPGWVRCPRGHAAVASGIATASDLFHRNAGRDVDMMLDAASPDFMLNDGSVIFRVDAFEQRR